MDKKIESYMDKKIIEEYEKYLSYADKKEKLYKELEALKKKHEKEIYNKECELNELEQSKNKSNKYLNKILHEYNKYGFDEESCLCLSTNRKLGQKVSSLEYFKKLLENKIGEKLVLVEYISKYKQEFDDWDGYAKSVVEKTLIDILLIPKSKQNQLVENFDKLNLQQYKKVIKELPYVFLLERSWNRGEYTQGLKEIKNKHQHFVIDFNDLGGDKGIFYNSDYNKDIEYDKIVLKTYSYCVKCEKLRQELRKQEELTKRIKENEKLKKQLEKTQKNIQNSEEYLQKYSLENDLGK